MATLNLIQTFNNIKDKFSEIKTTEHFVMDPLYDYHPRDLTSYDERRNEYNAMYPDKKEKRNRFFDQKDEKKEKCEATSISDTSCYGNLKGAIWVLIIVAIILTLIFIIFVISKMFSGSGSHPTNSQAPQRSVQTVQQSQPVPGQKRNFFDRFLGSKPEATPEQAAPPKADFMSRLIGSKPATTST
jgi:hypothetical protein